jgi:ATP-dependent DNA helicase UvrD/PcrA
MHVTYTTRRLLDYWTDESRDNPILFCQLEAAETAIFLAEAAPRMGDVWIRNKLAEENVERYLAENRSVLPLTEYSEQQVQVHVAPGITVDGRIDLIRRLDTNETSIVDFKSSSRAQAEDITRDQLHVYAVGYQELTGQRADLLEVLNLDPGGVSTREMVNDDLLGGIKDKIHDAGQDLRANRLPRLSRWCQTCDRCDLAGLCRSHP